MMMGSMAWCWWCFLFSLSLGLAGASDVMDPFGNITMKWDFQIITENQYRLSASIYNYQLYRHVESPGWKLGWTWQGDEVIWDLRGAEATEQGNCSRIKGATQLPHSCEKNPVIVDLSPGAPYTYQTKNCCRGGVLSSMTQDPSQYMATFEMSVGTVDTVLNVSDPQIAMPSNFSLGLPGYTCSSFANVKPTKTLSDDGRRYTQVLQTWQLTCTYSQFVESVSPSCCVSLSSFYSDTIVPCPSCACGCQSSPGSPQCVAYGDQPQVLQLPQDINSPLPTVVRCTKHMCPINVHWHVKVNYRAYWRVKVSITNLNIIKNYSDWTLVAQHPNLKSINQVFSFNYKSLDQYGYVNDTGVFWGIEHYNDMLMSSLLDGNGNVQTELLLSKDPDSFTFNGGWAFPRKIQFNGHECVMPQPDDYPKLPNRGTSTAELLFRNLFTLLAAPLLVFTLLETLL